jgi:hypothetical protein
MLFAYMLLIIKITKKKGRLPGMKVAAFLFACHELEREIPSSFFPLEIPRSEKIKKPP